MINENLSRILMGRAGVFPFSFLFSNLNCACVCVFVFDYSVSVRKSIEKSTEEARWK